MTTLNITYIHTSVGLFRFGNTHMFLYVHNTLMIPWLAERMRSCVGEKCTLTTQSEWMGKSSRSCSSASDHTYQMRERKEANTKCTCTHVQRVTVISSI